MTDSKAGTYRLKAHRSFGELTEPPGTLVELTHDEAVQHLEQGTAEPLKMRRRFPTWEEALAGFKLEYETARARYEHEEAEEAHERDRAAHRAKLEVDAAVDVLDVTGSSDDAGDGELSSESSNADPEGAAEVLTQPEGRSSRRGRNR